MENKPQFKPITMDCNQQQFDAIKPILEKHGFTFDEGAWNFTKWPYLTNNYDDGIGLSKIIGNAPGKNHKHRPYVGQWNQDLFLKCCGIESNPQFKVGDRVIIKKGSDGYGTYGWRGEFQNIIQTQGYLTVSRVTNREGGWQVIAFKESGYNADSLWLTLYTENKTEMKTYKRTIAQLKQIHDIACDAWKSKIKALITDPFADYIELSQQQVDEMFKAASEKQRTVLVGVFGEPEKHCPYKKGQLLWVWYNHYKYPNIRPFVKMDDDGKYAVEHNDGMGTISWDNAAPFNNGQLPDQFKHLLENQ